MNRRFSWPQMILLALIVVLILIGLAATFTKFIIPIIVLGSIFVLYKFPPDKWKYRRKQVHGVQKKNNRKSKAKLYVIQGSKSDDPDDDNDKPIYH